MEPYLYVLICKLFMNEVEEIWILLKLFFVVNRVESVIIDK
jgi:hypothetical protein